MSTARACAESACNPVSVTVACPHARFGGPGIFPAARLAYWPLAHNKTCNINPDFRFLLASLGSPYCPTESIGSTIANFIK